MKFVLFVKYLIVLIFFFLLISKINAQEFSKIDDRITDSISYVIIKIKVEWDNKNKVNFYSLDVEKGNKYANDLYSLLSYQNTSPQTDPVYGNENNDKRGKSFIGKKINYFLNTTEAFNFLAKLEWYLNGVFANISTNVSSSVEASGTFYYPNIISEPVYIFKKTIKNK